MGARTPGRADAARACLIKQAAQSMPRNHRAGKSARLATEDGKDALRMDEARVAKVVQAVALEDACACSHTCRA